MSLGDDNCRTGTDAFNDSYDCYLASYHSSERYCTVLLIGDSEVFRQVIQNLGEYVTHEGPLKRQEV